MVQHCMWGAGCVVQIPNDNALTFYSIYCLGLRDFRFRGRVLFGCTGPIHTDAFEGQNVSVPCCSCATAQDCPLSLAAMVKYSHVTSVEATLMKKLHEQGMGVRKIRQVTGRSFDTISKHIFKKHRPMKAKAKGRPPAITAAILKRLVKAHETLTQQRPSMEVTIKHIKAKVGLTCCDRVVLDALHKHGVYFRPLYEKLELTADDIKKRRAFAETHSGRTAAQWNRWLHAAIDNKLFQVYTNGKARDYAARRQLRGVYRTRARVYTAGNTKPSRTLKKNTGAKSVMVTCAVGAGRVLLWRVVPGNKWNAEAAERMYRTGLHPALEKAYPGARRWRVLEDNDPAGYKSSLAKQAKKDLKIAPVELPPRSPELNPLDFTVWSEINQRMRQQESAWPSTKTETRTQYLRRLRRTAMGLPTEYIEKAVGNLETRTLQLAAARGGHIREGGL